MAGKIVYKSYQEFKREIYGTPDLMDIRDPHEFGTRLAKELVNKYL